MKGWLECRACKGEGWTWRWDGPFPRGVECRETVESQALGDRIAGLVAALLRPEVD